MITLDITSDPICPWCYIAKARLDRALESRPDHPFALRWHPFQLNPDMPAEGMDRAVYLSAKFGGQESALAAYKPVIEAAEEAGLALDLAAIERVPNTRDAHRLIHWAGLEGRANAAVSALFRAYFTQGRDIGAPDVLLEIATEAGLDPALIARLLASDADRALIVEADKTARARGIRAVPFFIIGGEYALEGAQPTEFWQQVIDQIATPDT